MFDLVAETFGEVAAFVVVISVWVGGFWSIKKAAERLKKHQPFHRLWRFSWRKSLLR